MIRTTLAMATLLSLTLPASAQTSSTSGMSSMTSMTMPHCKSGDPVVWVNTKSKIYYMKDGKYYGKTTAGKYVCMSAAKMSGDRASLPSTPGGSNAPNQGIGTTSNSQ